MPQARLELHERFGNDFNAEKILLAAGYRYDYPHNIYYIPKGHEPTQDEWDAMEYLQNEWGYGVKAEQ